MNSTIFIPQWLKEHENEIIAVDCYEQKRFEGFLISNLSREEYENLPPIKPIEKTEDHHNNKIFYIYEKKTYLQSMNKIKDYLKEYGKEDLFQDIKENYNPNIIIIEINKNRAKKRKM